MFVFSQKKYTKHIVKENETISEIAEKYDVKLIDIYSLNPNINKLLQLNSIVLIPKKSIDKPNLSRQQKYIENSHEIAAKETLYGISKQYRISLKALYEANPDLVNKPLKIGEKITVPNLKELKVNSKLGAPILNYKKPTETNAISIPIFESVLREVLPKETKYSISKQYGISIQELEKQNPDIQNKLPIGFKLCIEIPISKNKNIEKPITDADTRETKNPTISFYNNDSIVQELIQKASECIGIKYHSGGSTNSGFDCSGLIYATFKFFDIEMPRSSFEQATLGAKIEKNNAKKGDLIFFKTNGRRQINHVGLITEIHENEIKFIHSSIQKGVVISSTKEKYYAKTFSQINRIFK